VHDADSLGPSLPRRPFLSMVGVKGAQGVSPIALRKVTSGAPAGLLLTGLAAGRCDKPSGGILTASPPLDTELLKGGSSTRNLLHL
jgi:hypothetical protein